MTKEELKEKLDGLIAQDECGMNIFFVLRKQDTFVLRKANVRHDALDPLKASLKEALMLSAVILPNLSAILIIPSENELYHRMIIR